MAPRPMSCRDARSASGGVVTDRARPRVIRSALLIAYADAMGSLGLDPYRMMRKVGLPVAALEQSHVEITADNLQALLAESARAGVCEEFGLLVGRAVQLSTMGPLGSLIRAQRTVRTALETLRRYLRYQNDDVDIRIDERDGLAVLGPVLLSPGSRRDRLMVEMTLAMILQILRALLGEAWTPVRVTLAHGAPEQLAPYRDVFGAVTFNCPINSIVLTQADLDTEPPDADAEMAREIARYFDRRSKPPSDTTTDIISDLIVRLLPTGGCDVDEVADRLGVDRRTVHRRLANEGQSFSRLLQGVRREVASEELCKGDRSLGLVTQMVGFTSLSSFSRWFHQAYGIRPSQFRRLAQRP